MLNQVTLEAVDPTIDFVYLKNFSIPPCPSPTTHRQSAENLACCEALASRGNEPTSPGRDLKAMPTRPLTGQSKISRYVMCDLPISANLGSWSLVEGGMGAGSMPPPPPSSWGSRCLATAIPTGILPANIDTG